ncbi:hypothetical protein [Pseudooceanicola sp. HF7]|uniref:hypothetical protein n=1 Tax=Pseudooceanicola sp. HF7 TaxID=2721560 RepID=UPI00142F8E61|nr:hypothetical protein [Pseudooceanicola sp. HF7]NIZ09010.1 hypothetical protein [Pseudooceanicola sp. HF7]
MSENTDGTTGETPETGGDNRLVLSPELRVEEPLQADTVLAETAAWPGEADSDPLVLDNRLYPYEDRRSPLTDDDLSEEDDWDEELRIDKAELRQMIREIVREELEFALKDMNMRAIRKMVKREIAKAVPGYSRKD